MTARHRVRSPGPCPLEVRDVERIVLGRAATVPRSTVDIADMCQAAYPHYPNINVWRVGKLLGYLHARTRVAKLSGANDTDLLVALGVPAPHRQWVYWTRPQAEAVPHGRVEDAVHPELPASHDGRAPFAAEAGDGERGVVRELSDTGRPGWWQRRAHEWIPVARPGRADT